MPTAKKPADETAKPARTRKPTTAKAAEASAKPTEPIEAVSDAAAAAEPTPDPRSKWRKDRMLQIAAAFLIAVAVFAVGFGIGRASGGGNDTIIGADMPHMGGFIPFGDGRGGQANPHDRGGMMVVPGPGGMMIIPGPGYENPNQGGDESTPPDVKTHAFLGIAGADAPAGGVLVNEVQPGSGADAAGLTVGDRIVSLDGTPVAGIDELSRLIASSQPGATIEIGLDRAGETLTLTATLGSR